MDLDEIQRKFPRISNGDGRLGSAEVVYGKKMEGQFGDEEDGKSKRGGGGDSKGGRSIGGVDLGDGAGGFYGWASSRIVRVSRASGGKDRHSKVLTSKGLRDRRVRLSVNTAIQFYDLQDRLGCDQPSKAVEWLLKAAASSISELPPMNSLFPDTPKQLSDEKRSSNGGSDQLGLDSVEVEMDGGGGGGGGGDTKYQRHQQMTKSSACSSTSETSKSSCLSLSRSESRIKARERAKERVAGKEKEKEIESSQVVSLNPLSHTTSFTELLSSGMNRNNPSSPNRPVQENSNGGNVNESNFFQKNRLWSSAPMEYFTAPGQIHFANSFTSMASPPFSAARENQTEIQQFSFVPDHFVPASNSNSNHNNGSNEYNLNFTISSSAISPGLAAYNGGTLQSNSTSPSLLPYNYLQRFSLIDGASSPSIFLGTAAPVENHHQFLPGFDARLQLSYGDPNANNGSRHSSQKGKGKN